MINYIFLISMIALLILLCFLPREKKGLVQKNVPDFFGLDREMPAIIEAAEKTECFGDDFLILLAIRKAENGRSGREFGIIHPRCLQQIENEPHKSLDIQAGWSAKTIVNTRKRWQLAGKPLPFIRYLGSRYCPPTADPQGYTNWVHNVNFWFEKFKSNGVNLQAGSAICKSMTSN